VNLPYSLIAKSLTDFCLCYFAEKNHPKPHYYLSVPINDNSSILLCIVTSQIENKLWYYRKTRREEAIQCLVPVDETTLPTLSRKSVVECNVPRYVLREDFGKIIDSKHGFKSVTREIPDDLKTQVIDAIKKSPLVKPYLKKLLP
jgi:hypothetical protein